MGTMSTDVEIDYYYEKVTADAPHEYRVIVVLDSLMEREIEVGRIYNHKLPEEQGNDYEARLTLGNAGLLVNEGNEDHLVPSAAELAEAGVQWILGCFPEVVRSAQEAVRFPEKPKYIKQLERDIKGYDV